MGSDLHNLNPIYDNTSISQNAASKCLKKMVSWNLPFALINTRVCCRG